MERRFTPQAKLPAHHDGLGFCWCGGQALSYRDRETDERHIQFFHNDDLGYAFELAALPFDATLMILAVQSGERPWLPSGVA